VLGHVSLFRSVSWTTQFEGGDVSEPLLPGGAYPLTRVQGILAAVLVGSTALLLAFFVPILARLANVLVVPPDAVRFGAASLVTPLPENQRGPYWRVVTAESNSVTMTKGGVTVRASTGVTESELSQYFDDLIAAYPKSGMSASGAYPNQLGPVTYHSRGTATDGYIAWLEGSRRSAVLVVIPVYSSQPGDGTTFVEVVVEGSTSAMDRLTSDVEAMLGSIRYSGGGGT
jgi:hypothetical protein